MRPTATRRAHQAVFVGWVPFRLPKFRKFLQNRLQNSRGFTMMDDELIARVLNSKNGAPQFGE
jgi:hypothetical protein